MLTTESITVRKTRDLAENVTIPILMYHQIDVPPPSGTPLRGLVVSPGAFARQMAWLRLAGVRALSMRDLEPYLTGEKTGRVVGVTFDDGYRNNLHNALPVLQRHGFTATCYVVSNGIGGHNSWDRAIGVPDKPLMDMADLRAWHSGGMDVGAHTRDHVDLTHCSPDHARDQIAGSKGALEQALGTEVRHFCYPYGWYDASHAAMAREAGFITATTTRRGRARVGDDPMTLRRVLVAQATHLGYFSLKLWTGYEDRRG